MSAISVDIHIGTACVRNKKTQSEESVGILKRDGDCGRVEYEVVSLSEDKERTVLAKMHIDYLKPIGTNGYGSEYRSHITDYSPIWYYGVGCENPRTSKVFIERLESNNETYKGLHKLLFQVAIEESFHAGFQGRVMIDAPGCTQVSANRHGWKSGEFNEVKRGEAHRKLENLAREKKNKKELSASFSYMATIYMHLPQEQITTWKMRIDKAPIHKDWKKS